MIGGVGMQFVMGLLVLRWRGGYKAMKFISDQATTFMEYSMYAAAELFGDPFFLFHAFAFLVIG